MIKVYCDVCGKVIDTEKDRIEINICIPKINSDDQPDYFDYETKHVCKGCESKFRNVFRKEETL